MNNNKYIGKIVFVKLPNNNRPRWRWIVRKQNDRYIVRSPKVHVLIKDLKHKRDKDFNDESILPLGSIIDPFGKKTRKWSKTHKNKTRRQRR